MIVVGNRRTQDHFSKVLFYIFQVLKNIKKEYIEMTKKICLETFEKYPGSLCFPLLFLLPENISRMSRFLVVALVVVAIFFLFFSVNNTGMVIIGDNVKTKLKMSSPITLSSTSSV